MWCAASNWRRHDGERRERVAASLATPSSPLNPGARGVEFRRRTEVGSEPSRPSILQAALKVLSSTNFPPAEAQISQSIVVMLKIEILDAVPGSFSTVREALRSLDHPLFPTETAVHIPDEIHSMGEDEKSKGNSIWFRSETNSIWRGFLWDKKLEAIFCAIIQYLQHCASSTLPYNAAKTLKKIGMSPPRRIHPAHQARLAERIGIIFETEQASELVDAVIDLKWWALYAGGHKTEEEMKLKRKRGFLPWLQDPDARQMITDTFVKYKGKSKARAEKIVEGLKCWHPEGTAPNAVAQSGDTPAGERRAEPIASSSRDRSSEEGGE
ncbi:hypothetical protein C8R46DRAFT_1037120 [Mycena filopes]|nr:hypothetical protein C8R46DRAFT_1037120 [Mycena filopes]